jgi:hypothetical protein
MADDSYKFGLLDCKIAVWNSDESYGTAVDVPSVQVLGIEFQTVTANLEGDDVITDTHAKQISAQITLRFGFQSVDVLAILTGETHASSNNDDSMIFGDQNYPYFAICGRVDDTQGGGNDVWFAPKCKITGGWSIRMEYGNYVIPEITAMAVYETATYGIATVFQYDSATAVAIPPTAIGS